MSNDFIVLVVQLQNADGTRYTVNGLEDEESLLTFVDGEQRTIQSLKAKINSLYFPAANRPIGKIKVYSSPNVASVGSPQAWVNHKQLREALVEGKTYGFIDLTSAREQQQQEHVDIRDIAEFARTQMREAETLVFSKVKSDIYREVTSNLDLKVKGAKWSKRPPDLPDVDRFTWSASEEDSEENRNGYMNYLRENMQWPDGYAVTDCNEYKDLLSVPELDGKHKTSGNIDVVLAAQEDVENGAIRQNIRAGIELKKDTNEGNHENQVVLQHLAASTLNPNESVLTVMTDLNERWHFYWFGQERGRMYKCVVGTRGEAKFLFEHMFDSPDSIDSSILFPTDFLVRGTWRVFFESDLATIRESHTDDSGGDGNFPPDSGHSRQGRSGYPRSHGDDQGGKKDGSKGGVARGQQVAGNNYGMDVANELELLDFVDEEEKRAIELRFLAEHVVPKMTYVPEQNRHNTEGEGYYGLSEANLSFHNASRLR